LEYVIRKFQEKQAGRELNKTHQLLVYADDVNLLGDNIATIKKNIHSLTHSLMDSARFEKPPKVQPLKNFPGFYGTRRFITVSTRALHWSIFSATSI
jgi:hypothetical protein